MSVVVALVVVGGIATALLDLWNLALNRLFGFPLPNWALIGRWFCHMPRGRFVHAEGIAKAAPVANETAIGWAMHYLIGFLFAFFAIVLHLVMDFRLNLMGGEVPWPMVWPGLIVGWVTILAGWLILAPGLGNGIAHARTANPTRARLLNLAGHTVFGLGLWLGIVLIDRLT